MLRRTLGTFKSMMVTKTNKFEPPPQPINLNLNKVKCKHKKITTYQDSKNDC